MDLEKLQTELRAFAKERDWEPFHTPKNLVMALAGEVGELTEIFQWLTPAQSAAVMTNSTSAQQVRDELADVFVYCVRLADVLGIDLAVAVDDKIKQNAAKYPVHLAKGNALKYSDLKE